jgi:hypothetical protein
MTQVAQAQTTQAAQQQQTTQAQAFRLKELGIAEIVALAVNRKRALEEKGKTSRRVVLHLSPWQIPPRSGVYSSWLGEVKIFSTFRVEEGKWVVEVKLPPMEGFAVKDYTKRSDTQKPSPSQPSGNQQ